MNSQDTRCRGVRDESRMRAKDWYEIEKEQEMTKRLLFTLMVSCVVASSTGCGGCLTGWLCGGGSQWGGTQYGSGSPGTCATGDCGTCSSCTQRPACGGAPACGGCFQCFSWLRNMFTCNDGCGESYYGDWQSDPPAACDNCNKCSGTWTGSPIGGVDGQYYDLRSTVGGPTLANQRGQYAGSQPRARNPQARLASNPAARQARQSVGIRR